MKILSLIIGFLGLIFSQGLNAQILPSERAPQQIIQEAPSSPVAQGCLGAQPAQAPLNQAAYDAMVRQQIQQQQGHGAGQ